MQESAWRKASARYLGQIQELLGQMAQLAQAGANFERDQLFSDLKRQISLLIDGNSGQFSPQATLDGVPLFLGYRGINLYTRYSGGRPARVSVPFAEHVWGADNGKAMREHLFVPLTEGERRFRQVRGIGPQNPIPQTAQEVIARRRLNIFDGEYGSLRSEAMAERMYRQVRAAMGQIHNLGVS